MYYLKMKTAVRPDSKSKKFRVNKSYIFLREKEISLVNIKFYQKLFVIFISLSTFLIFPESPTKLENVCEKYNQKIFIVMISLSTILIFSESPRELENICENYNSRKLCNVW